MRYLFSIFICSFLTFLSVCAQSEPPPDEALWNQLTTLCGNVYSAQVIAAPENDSFRGQELLMHVRYCSDTEIRIPFFVGEDRSRTWVFTKSKAAITLKHDYRHEDSSEDELIQYGGT